MLRFGVFVLCLILPWAAHAQGGPAYAAFGQHPRPSAGAPDSFGTYTRGCLAGGALLPEVAPLWQAMKPARNRYWGHPEMVQFIQRLAVKVRDIGWPGLYIGDIGQPRGGPMKSGHRSHQMGLDVDIWLRKPTTWRPMNRQERNGMWSYIVVAKNGVDLNANWTESHHQVLRAAASDPAVARIFVNSAIKRWMCRRERGSDGRVDAPWLRKIRPWKGHNAHFHVRLKCPVGARFCRGQGAPPPGPGCGAEISKWHPGGSKAKKRKDKTKSEPSEEGSGEVKHKWAGRKAKERGVKLESGKDAPKQKKTRAISLGAMPPQCHAVLADNAAELARINANSEEILTTIALPIFYKKGAEAHEGYVGTRYFWRPKVDLNAARARDVSLGVEGELPPGLQFLDRGNGNALIRGTPEAHGWYSFTLVARAGGSEAGRQVVRMPIIDLDSGKKLPAPPKLPDEDAGRPGAGGVPGGELEDDVLRPADGTVIGAPPSGDRTEPDETPDDTMTDGETPDDSLTGGETPDDRLAGGAAPYDPFRKDPLTLSLEHEVKDFLTEFTGDECFLAVPHRIAKADIQIETFADDKEPILEFDRVFLRAIGIEAQIGGRLISQLQCPALAFVRAYPYGSPAPIETEPVKRIVAPGERITIAVAAARVRSLSMMVVWPDGRIFDLTDHLRRVGNRYAVTVKAAGLGPQVIVALDTAKPLSAEARAKTVRERDLFATTGDDPLVGHDLDVRASLALIIVQE